jgi:hypothetical protein
MDPQVSAVPLSEGAEGGLITRPNGGGGFTRSVHRLELIHLPPFRCGHPGPLPVDH